MSRIILRSCKIKLWVKLIYKNLICSHTYCDECIKNWLNSVNSVKEKVCPICRSKTTKNSLSRDLIAFNIINDMEVFCNNNGKEMLLKTLLLKNFLNNKI